jgi:O-antigen/teichoic acid export membrane protein
MTEPSLKQQAAKGILWSGLSNGLQQLLGVAFGIILARILSQEDYGLMGMLAIFSGIALAIINSGFSVALTNKQDAAHRDYNAVFWFTVLAGAALYILLFFSAPLIGWYFKRPELIPLARFLFLNFLISGMGTASYTVLFKKLMIKQQALIDVTSMIIALSIGTTMAFHGFAYWALATQVVVQYSVASILRFIIAPWKPTLHIDFAPLKPIFSFSFKLLLTTIFIQINNNLFGVIFGKLYGANQVGIYNQGQKWMGMGQQFIGGTITYITQPLLVQVHENQARQIHAFRKLIRFGAFISFPLMLGLAFVGEEFIVIAIGEKWLSSVPFLRLSCIWGSVIFLTTLYTNLIFTHGKSDWYLYGTIITGLAQLAVVLALHPLGMYVMVIGFVITYLASLFLWHYYASKIIRLRLLDVLRDTLPYLLITLACFLAAHLFATHLLPHLLPAPHLPNSNPYHPNPYLLITTKITISSLLYIFILKSTRSVIYRESIAFLLSRFKKH